MTQLTAPAASLANRYSQWTSLQAAQKTLQAAGLRRLFSDDAQRAQHFTSSACGITLDYSKHFLDAASRQLLIDAAKEAGLPAAIEALFSGQPVNNTEERAALHVALRSPHKETSEERAVHATLAKLFRFVEQVHSGEWRGFSGRPISDVINIGIGGSDLGPRMATEALKPFHRSDIRIHFVANVDAADLLDKLAHVQPATTLFIIASKSFSTLETLENSLTARQWLLDAGCPSPAISRHFIASTSRVDKAVDFGIAEENLFPMWDWVGGRYSLWSSIGLPIALAVGNKHFKALLAGGHAMDEHFRQTDFEHNLPVLMGLLTFWYSQFWQAESWAILPYNNLLRQFPAFLQQLDMESLGKGVNREGEAVGYPTGMVIWGSEGTVGQHSFHQLLHQGRRFIPADFIVNRRAQHGLKHHQEQLFASCLSQSQALMNGKSLEQAKQELLSAGLPADKAEQLAPHKVIPGNRPSTTLFMDELNPTTLGALIALYEHKVYVQSVLLNINAFDQWGVELGKQLGAPILEALRGSEEKESFDSSTRQLIDCFKG